MDTLVLHETRPHALDVISSLFAQGTGVQIVQQGTVFAFHRNSTLDAIILSPPVAYELYGGAGFTAQYHQDNHLGRPMFITDALILDSHESPLERAVTPVPWIVTYPGFKTRIHDTEEPSASATDTVDLAHEIEGGPLTLAEMVYVEFISIFEKVYQANIAGLTPPICRLGCSTQSLFRDHKTLAPALTAVRDAFRDQRHT